MSYAHGCTDELRQACHDIRQPIAGVLALAEVASCQADLRENTRQVLDKIIGLAGWQSHVIGHWLRTREAVGAQQAAWASDLTVLWLPGPVLVRLPRVTLRRMTGGLRGARVSLLLPIAASRKGGRIANAASAL
jgi:hypothetical protein